MRTVVPPAAVGMLGGGQLGRYAIAAARTMGYRTIVLDPDPDAPAGRIADEHLVAAYDDPAAVDRLASTCTVVTTEFENPPSKVLTAIAERTTVAPAASTVAIAQDRTAEKRFLTRTGIPVVPYASLQDGWSPPAGDLRFPAIVKTARLGYDGKGQLLVRRREELGPAWRELGGVPCVLEERVTLDAEVSVVVARNEGGELASFDVAENVHVGGILDLTVVPARIDERLAVTAAATAHRIAEVLDYVGVLAVEMFVSNGALLVNELAPRPHNSGHWTLDAARTSQFEQQVRAVCGLALGDPGRTWPAVAMVNLLGDEWSHGEPHWGAADDVVPEARLHLYGKRDARPGRKMGHLTVVGESPDDVAERALDLRARLRRG